MPRGVERVPVRLSKADRDVRQDLRAGSHGIEGRCVMDGFVTARSSERAPGRT